MKNKLLYPMICAAMLLTWTGCDDESTDGMTRITYYPIITLEGESTMFVAKGTPFVEPGYTAMEGEEDVTDGVTISVTTADGEAVSQISTSAANLYTVTYSAVNVDGFSASVSRSVFVYDPDVTASIAGTYNVDMDKSYYQKQRTFADRAAYYGKTDLCTGVVFTELAPGVYYCNDLFGGWYNQIRGYGASYGTRYDMTGYVLLNTDNTISLLRSYVQGWGDGLDYISDSLYDPATGVLSYSLSYAGQIYIDLVLIKQ